VKPSKPDRAADSGRDERLVDAVCRWFCASARPLPWRTAPRDAYASLVSEVMAQQTQITRVVERYGEFLARFPTARSLAEAPEGEVLRLWSGLGYYRRARNLQAAAKEIVSRFDGAVPPDVQDLRSLPGVGRYTAGAIASIVFNRPEPIVDGNVGRVLMRVEGKELAHASPEAQAWSWERAGVLVGIAGAGLRGRSPAALNEGLMELGATVCTPANPRCTGCPLAADCTARHKGSQERIPRPKVLTERKVLRCTAAVLTDPKGRVLLEQRPGDGMWAGLWQAPTLEAARTGQAALTRWLGIESVKKAGTYTHQTSHREVRFAVWKGVLPARHPARKGRVLVDPAALADYGMGSAQRRVIALGLTA
jgi:A/G-specific adenine glycosylase